MTRLNDFSWQLVAFMTSNLIFLKKCKRIFWVRLPSLLSVYLLVILDKDSSLNFSVKKQVILFCLLLIWCYFDFSIKFRKMDRHWFLVVTIACCFYLILLFVTSLTLPNRSYYRLSNELCLHFCNGRSVKWFF